MVWRATCAPRCSVSPSGLIFALLLKGRLRKWSIQPPIPSRKSWIRTSSPVYVAREVPANAVACVWSAYTWKLEMPDLELSSKFFRGVKSGPITEK
ncbi:hypothetical protein M8J77_012675 [Diaphorina citri]|nr:hypothetical protein M8J77_012675 [Diaphorina citri]